MSEQDDALAEMRQWEPQRYIGVLEERVAEAERERDSIQHREIEAAQVEYNAMRERAEAAEAQVEALRAERVETVRAMHDAYDRATGAESRLAQAMAALEVRGRLWCGLTDGHEGICGSGVKSATGGRRLCWKLLQRNEFDDILALAALTAAAAPARRDIEDGDSNEDILRGYAVDYPEEPAAPASGEHWDDTHSEQAWGRDV